MSSSRGGHRRRDRSWERDDRDRDRDRNRERYESSRGGARGHRDEKKRSSRSRSPRRGDRDRDNRRDRRDRDHDYRRDGDRRDGDRDRRDDGRRERDDRRDSTRKDDKSTSNRDEKHPRDVEMKDRAASRTESSSHQDPPKGSSTPSARPSIDPKTPEHIHEDGEAVDDDTDMMAAMGLGGFGSTKGKHVEGNQEGATDVKKIRTWRQYMNRRGGFNRPLDKIK